MKYFVQIAVLIFFTSTLIDAQLPSPTPTPELSDAQIERKAADDAADKKHYEETSPHFTKYLLITRDTGESIIISANTSHQENSAPPKVFFSMQFEQRTLEEVPNKGKKETAKLVIDGKEIPFPSTSIYKIKHDFVGQPRPYIRFELFTAKIKQDDLSLLNQAQSITIFWDKAVIVIPPEGIEGLHQFMANEYEWLSKRR